MLHIDTILTWSEKNQRVILWSMIGLISAAMICGVVIKYNHFGYNAMDLGIYSQVFFNTAHGRLFEFSIHPHSYLGDHFELIILALAPLYAACQSPVTLLILQVLALTAAAWPLYLIAKKILPSHFSLLVALAWLINPFVWNMAFFEFHILPFAIILIFFTYYFFERKKFLTFAVFSALSLTVREDVSLVIAMFGCLSLIQRRSWKWFLWPIVTGGIWFIVSMQLTGFFNMYGSYKFLSMYPWLGDTMTAALKTITQKPWLLIIHLITFKNALLSIGLMLPLAALPLVKPKTLALGTLVAIQLFLSGFGPTVVLETHYTALLLPVLFISAIAGLSYLTSNTTAQNDKKPFILRYRWLYGIVISTAIIYAFVFISPIAALGRSLFSDPWDKNTVKINTRAVQQILPQDAVAAGYDYLGPLANRKQLYSLNYAFLGKKQYSDQEYHLPSDTNRIVMNASDFITYQLQHSDKPEYRTGAARILSYISDFGLGIDSVQDSVVVYSKNVQSDIKLFEYTDALPVGAKTVNQAINQNMILVGWDKKNNLDYAGGTHEIELSMYWKLMRSTSDNLNILFTLWDGQNKKPYEKIFPFGYGLAPTFNWPTDKLIVTNFWIVPPEDNMTLTASLIDIAGYLDLDGWRTAKNVLTKKNTIGPVIAL
ncbi:MAG: DUF2079 domain-containing protein [Patescibacteria group bacterium]